MVGTKSPSSADPTYLRKIRKPMVEKRRRDRMNTSLAQLKSLLAVNIKQTGTSTIARLDKADILELTVNHLTTLQHQHRSATLATSAEGYKKGFKDCARETFQYLSSTQRLDTDSLHHLNNHIQSCYMVKTGRGPVNQQPVRTNSVGASAQPDVASSRDCFPAVSAVTPVTPSQHATYIPVGLDDNTYKEYGQYWKGNEYDKLNDSVDTSLNSSCNMSLDSSSNVTPEKVVPFQITDDVVWRPW